MLKFSASVLSREAPVYGGDSFIAFTFQRRDLSLQCHLVADSEVETLGAQDAQFYLCHVQPSAVHWGVVELQSLGDTARFCRLEGIVQRTQLVCVEIVQHQPYRLGVRICLINQPSHLMCEVRGSTSLGNLAVATMPPACASTPHYHVNCESAIYVLKGTGRFLTGKRLENSLAIGPGDFIYVPPDSVHQPVNNSLTEPMELIVARNAPVEIVVEYDPTAE